MGPRTKTRRSASGVLPEMELVRYLDQFLAIRDFEDDSWNGLQVEGGGEVRRIATAVDPTLVSIEGAAIAGARILLVHHGLFWGSGKRIVGPLKSKIARLLSAGVALYAAHLPLDAHAEVGNNVCLARKLGLSVTGPFGKVSGAAIGVLCELAKPLDRDKLADRFARVVEHPVDVQALGPSSLSRIAIITGNGSSTLPEAAARAVDCLVTGEWTYTNYQLAREHGVNVLSGGHYATETLGVQALGDHVAKRFGLPHTFVPDPSPM